MIVDSVSAVLSHMLGGKQNEGDFFFLIFLNKPFFSLMQLNEMRFVTFCRDVLDDAGGYRAEDNRQRF